MASRTEVIELREPEAPTRLETGAPEVDEEEAPETTAAARVDSYRRKMSVLVGSGLVQLPIWGTSIIDTLVSCAH